MAADSAATARQEEREVMEEIYQSDFSVASETEWRIALGDDCMGACLVVKLPSGYPESEAPEPILQCDSLNRQRCDELLQELRGLWQPGEGCVFQWADHAKAALQAATEDEGTGAAREPQGSGSAGVADEPVSQEAVRLKSGQAAALGASLVAAGFLDCSGGIFAHSDKGVTVEASDAELSITVDGIDAEDLTDWASMQLQVDLSGFGKCLLNWAQAQREAEGFADAGDADTGSGGLDYLPSPESLGVNTARSLHIYTWGKALRKAPPPDSQYNFNAGVLNGRGGGADLRTMNGLSEEVQSNVASCGLFPRWIEMVCSKIEGAGLHTVSINCTKGRHRSVAAAEILARIYYPSATKKHLTIH